MILELARVLGLPGPPADDMIPSLSMDMSVSNWSRYKSKALGVHPS